MERRLNLGCGTNKLEGYVNVDANAKVEPDIILNLNDCDEYWVLGKDYDEIRMEHVLEHLNEPFLTMKELGKLLKKGGKLIVKVPHFSRGFTHAEHAHGFDCSFALYFQKWWKGYIGPEYKLKKMKMTWMIRMDLKNGVIPDWSINILKAMNSVFSWLANLSPHFCSRFWCYYVGGFEEIEYEFEA